MRDVIDIEPISCTSIQEESSFRVAQMAKIAVTFKDSSSTIGETREMGFLVIKNSLEYLLFGKPTLDELGCASDKLNIELRCLGLRFALMLPHELKDGQRVRSFTRATAMSGWRRRTGARRRRLNLWFPTSADTDSGS